MMNENTPVEEAKQPQTRTLKCFWWAAIVGAVTALWGVFAYCVYHGYTRLHEGACDCAKYGAMMVAAFSHPIAIAGALAGVSVLSAAYLVKHLYKCFHQRRGDSKDRTNQNSH